MLVRSVELHIIKPDGKEDFGNRLKAELAALGGSYKRYMVFGRKA